MPPSAQGSPAAGGVRRRDTGTRRWLVTAVIILVVLALATVLRGRLPIAGYYFALTQPYNALADRLGVSAGLKHLPLISAFILGLLGTLAPCQLTSNLAAVSLAARQAGHPSRVVATVGGYVGGKMTVYALIGISVALFGLRIDHSAHFVPLVEGVRKAMGPLLVVAGLGMMDALPLRLSAGSGLAAWLEARLPADGPLRPYALGAVFALAFCPTLFLLFFGLTLPLAVGTGLGIAVPLAFALGTATPVMVLGLAITLGGLGVRPVLAGARRLDRWLSVAAGLGFIVLGLNELVLYWLI